MNANVFLDHDDDDDDGAFEISKNNFVEEEIFSFLQRIFHPLLCNFIESAFIAFISSDNNNEREKSFHLRSLVSRCARCLKRNIDFPGCCLEEEFELSSVASERQI